MSQSHPIPQAFASAVQPISGSTVIHTDDVGLVTGSASVGAADGESLPLYFARPEGEGPHAVVLVVQEIFGVHEHIKDVARRLAKEGYFAVAPELYFRQGDPSGIQEVERLRAEIVSKVPDDQVLADLDTAATWAAGQGGESERLGIVGFCWGGRIVWLYAAHQPRLKAGVAWYGKLTGEQNPRTRRHPLDVLAELKAPVLGLYGGKDAGIPLDTVARAQTVLSDHGGASRIEVYREAGHAFHADYRPSYRAEDAFDGWHKQLRWLEEHGL